MIHGGHFTMIIPIEGDRNQQQRSKNTRRVRERSKITRAYAINKLKCKGEVQYKESGCSVVVSKAQEQSQVTTRA